jgi:hypothetical protein
MRVSLVAVVVVLVTAASISACGTTPTTSVRGSTTASSHERAPGATELTVDTTPAALGLAPADRRLRDTIELNTSSARVGTPLRGTLVVTDDTAIAVSLTHGCRPSFAVVLVDRHLVNRVAFAPSCLHTPLVIEPGVNRLAVEVLTSYSACGSPTPHPAAGLPVCVRGGPPELPAGRYQAVLEGSGNLRLPEPRPVTVTLSS